MALLGLISFACYFNFGLWHFRNYVHQWDTFHYYVGSKYFKELSYDRLYECVAVADAEEPGLRRRVELRKVMNLRTNMMEGTQQILAHPEDCKGHFTPERWEAFKHDVAYFRGKHDVKRWEEAQTDHGYNGTPVWNIVGTTLANSAPASDDQIDFLTKIDPLFIFGITLHDAGGRSAGARPASRWPCSPPTSRHGSTGPAAPSCAGTGCSISWAGVCLVKKERPFLGGFFLGYSTLLRIFPLFTFAGPILVLLRQLWGSRRPIGLDCRSRCGWKATRAVRISLAGRRVGALLARIDRRYIAHPRRARRWRSRCWCRSAWSPATASTATRRSSSTPTSTRRRRSPTTWGCAPSSPTARRRRARSLQNDRLRRSLGHLEADQARRPSSRRHAALPAVRRAASW